MDEEEYGEDRRRIAELTEALYSSISFEEGESPDLKKLKKLFIHEGMLINNNDDPQIMSIDQFAEEIEEQLSSGSLKSFFERVIAGRTEIFGKIAHRFSTYEAKLDLEATEPLSIGINSFRFVKVSGVLKVVSIVWNDQTEDRLIPEKYL